MRILLIFSLIAAMGLLTFCGSDSPSGTAPGALSLQIVWHDAVATTTQSLLQNGTARVVQHAAPTDVVNVLVLVIGPNMPKMYQVYQASLNQGTIFAIPVGRDRTIIVQGENNYGQVTYNGVTTGVEINPGTNTYSVDVWPQVATDAFGTLKITSNIDAAQFEVFGPENFVGVGKNLEQADIIAGSYTIMWNTVTGYTTPAPQTLTLEANGTITFDGQYLATALTSTTTTANLLPDTIF